MYRTNLVLKTVNKETGLAKIAIEITFGSGVSRERVYISTDEKIPIAHWNKGNISRANKNSKEILYRVEVIHNKVKGQLFEIKQKVGFVSKELFKRQYFAETETQEDFLTLFESFILVKKLTAKVKLVEKLNAIFNQMKEFLGSKILYLHEIDQKFINELAKFWRDEKGLQPNTISKNFKFIRQFLNYLKNEEILQSSKYQRLDYPGEVETNTIVLSKVEVMKLMEHDPKTLSLGRVRDLFLILIFTGLRFGDAVRINRSWVRGEVLYINTQKTGEKVTIPIHPKLRELLKKYDFDLSPLKISNQRFNDYVKILCKDAEITAQVEIVRYVKGIKKYLVFPKYQLIASHTGRRTFITNAILAGIPLSVIQRITGHKKLVTLQKYVDIAEGIKVEEMEKLSRFYGSERS